MNAIVETTEALTPYAVPPEDTAEFARLPDRVRKEVNDRLAAFEYMSQAASVRKGAMAIAARNTHRRGWSVKRLMNLYKAYRDSGCDWQCLANKAKAGPGHYETERVRLPGDFVEYWKSLCDRNNRSCAPAHKKLLRRWELWRDGDPSKAIPGYQKCPPASAKTRGVLTHPEGWSYANLMRYRPTDFELTVARIGRTAASSERPLMSMTRAGLKVGRFLQVDDMWYNFKVMAPGEKEPQRLLQLGVLDLYSACLFAHGLKPVTRDQETNIRKQIQQTDMLFLLASVFGSEGYRMDEQGTTIIDEHRTARVPDEVAKVLFDYSGGKIVVDRSGIENQAALAGFFGGPGGGNPRYKAALESLQNLIQNETADTEEFPGQTGSNARLNAPEELAAREKHARTLLEVMKQLPREDAEKLSMPFLWCDDARRIVGDVLERINDRRDHDLEGWSEAGLVELEFRLHSELPWMPQSSLLKLSAKERQIAEKLAETRPAPLSPRQVFQRGRGDLRKLPPEALALILGPKCSRPVKVKAQKIEFDDQTLGPGHLRYDASHLPAGAKYDGVVNPMDLSRLYLFDAKGRYQGSVRGWQKDPRDDPDALKRQLGRLSKIESSMMQEVKERGAPVTKDRIKAARNNIKRMSDKSKKKPTKIGQGAKAEDFLNLHNNDDDEPTAEFETEPDSGKDEWLEL